MQIVEYKKHLVGGKLTDPDWIKDGSHLMNPIDKTYVGLIEEDEVREYYIPDTVVIMTLQDVIDRSLRIHASIPYRHIHLENEPEFSNEDVENFVTTYINHILS